MKDPFRYRIVAEWSDEDEAFVARVPALPGCAAHGDTLEEAAHEAEVAATAILDVMRAQKRPIPQPDTVIDYSGNLRIRLPRSLHRALTALAEADDVSLNQLMVAALQSYATLRDRRVVEEIAKLRASTERAAQAVLDAVKTAKDATDGLRAHEARLIREPRKKLAVREPSGKPYGVKKTPARKSSSKHTENT